MPVLDGLSVSKRLKQANVRAKIVMLTMHEDPEFVKAALCRCPGLRHKGPPRHRSDPCNPCSIVREDLCVSSREALNSHSRSSLSLVQRRPEEDSFWCHSDYRLDWVSSLSLPTG